MNSRQIQSQVRIQSKRNVELWIYSFADMYMIMSVFFIALAVIFAAKSKRVQLVRESPSKATAGRGPASLVSDMQVTFDPGIAKLSPEGVEELKLLLPVVQGLKNVQVEIEGYADASALNSESGFSSNLDLSTKRAVSVAEWLIKNGIPSDKIRVFGYGSGHIFPRSKVGTNRRVVVKVTTGAKP